MIAVGDQAWLRALEAEDLAWVHAMENDAAIWHLGIAKEPLNKHVLHQYLANQPGTLHRDGQLRLALEVEGKLAGALDLFDFDASARRGGIGIYIDAEHRGQGWSAKALAAFENYLFGTLGLNSVFAHVPADNPASLALFRGAGYTHIGTLEQWVLHGGQFVAAELFQKIKG